MEGIPEQPPLDGLGPDQRSLFDAASDSRVDEEGSDEDPDDAYSALLEPLEGDIDALFRVWVDGSETDWARAAWHALGRQGLLSTSVDDPECALDNAALYFTLAAIHRRFNGVRMSDGQSSEWQWAAPSLDAAELGVTEIDAGRWAALHGLFDPSTNGETVSGLVQQRVYSLVGEVLDALEKEWGDNALFTSLWLVTEADATYPPSPEDAYRVMNFPDGEMMDCYQWLMHQQDV